MLFVVSTPIGNFDDISLRALEVLKTCDVLIGEEHRVASTLLKKLDLPQKEIYLLNEHTKKDDLFELVDLCKTKNVALVSDCGTPSFSDPGSALVALCRKKNIHVTTAPGASSLMAILSLSSQKITQFNFVGLLPANKEERQKALLQLKTETGAWVVLDTPYRLKPLLSDLAREMPTSARALIGLNLTQENETLIEGTFKEIEKQCQFDEAEFIILKYAAGVS